MGISTKTDGAVEAIKKPAFMATLAITYISYIFLFLGISYILPSYIRTISNGLHILIGLILLYKFNPFRTEYKLTEYDNNLIFGMALFLIINTGVTEITISFFNTLKNVFNAQTNEYGI